MRETELYRILSGLEQKINMVDQRSSLGVSSEAVRNQSLYKLLLKKNLITEPEFVEMVGEVLRELNNPKTEEIKEEEPKVELATPTPEQVAEIQKSVVEESK